MIGESLSNVISEPTEEDWDYVESWFQSSSLENIQENGE